MSRHDRPTWDRAELLSLLSSSATLSGLCITVVALMQTLGSRRNAVSIVDDLFALCAAAFLLCTYLIFWALRARQPGFAQSLARLTDALFLLALSVMTVATFIMLYTLW